jgi:hypothetical protein
MSAEISTIFVNGIRTFPKNDNSPEWVVGNGVIVPRELLEFLKSTEAVENMTEYKGQKQLPITMIKNRNGSIGFRINNYKPKAEVQVQGNQEDDSDLPF